MSDDTTFAGENPFTKLDKTLFRTTETEKARQHATDLKKSKTPLGYGSKNNNLNGKKSNSQALYGTDVPSDTDDAALFLGAVSAAKPLNKDAKASSRTNAEPNPFAGKRTKKNSMPDKTGGITCKADSSESSDFSSDSSSDSSSDFSSDFSSSAFFSDEAAFAFKDTMLSDHASAPSGKPLARQKAHAGAVQSPAKSAATATPAPTNPDEEPPFAFMSAMSDVTPLSGKGRDVPADVPAPAPMVLEEPCPLQEFMEGKLEFTLASTNEYVEGHVIGLDLMLVGKLQAGQLSPEGHIDLHGLNAQQAFQALVGFIRGAYLKGQRTVLVVPGRGKNSPYGMSILREKVQNWFTQEPFRRVILAFCTARPTDGGAGAMYVLLRKLRKDRGKVYWDRRPVDPDLLD